MPDVIHRGCSIHYEVAGSGPLIVLLHGFLSNESSWREYGYVDGLEESFTVATVDSLGHGRSDKPTQPERYRLEERAGDIVAVIEALGEDKAHVLGYSMGGWLAVGVAMHYPDRLSSLTIAGWDCIDGMDSAYRAAGIDPMDFHTFLSAARAVAPELVEWVTDVDVGALVPCYAELADLSGSEKAVLDLEVPVLLWDVVGWSRGSVPRSDAGVRRRTRLRVPVDTRRSRWGDGSQRRRGRRCDPGSHSQLGRQPRASAAPDPSGRSLRTLPGPSNATTGPAPAPSSIRATSTPKKAVPSESTSHRLATVAEWPGTHANDAVLRSSFSSTTTRQWLLFRGGDPSRPDAGTWWFLPGGGLERTETFEDAAPREVFEETGCVIDELGPILLRREFDFLFDGQSWQAEEVYFVVRTDRFEVSSDGWDDVERRSIREHRWWGVDGLPNTEETVHPDGLAELVVRHRRGSGSP